MPMPDYGMEFSEGAKGFTATTTYTGVMDAGSAAGKDWGAGEKLVPMARVGGANFDNLTSIQFDVIAADANDGTGNAVVLSTKTVLLAALLKDSIHKLPPLASGVSRRYLVGKATLAGTAPSAGKTLTFGLYPLDSMPENVANP